MFRTLLTVLTLSFCMPFTSCKLYKGIITSEGGCDSSKWKHVYRPNRLKILQSCITATGIITGVDSSSDGDASYFLTLDAGQDTLLYRANYQKLKGTLMIEVICAKNTERKDPGKGCANYVNDVHLPAVGDHVRITGTYVIDRHNNWAEIHPVSRLEKL
ncbi:MAG: hypothetical protein JWP88_1394 [Flaviaesturariibacter sp.]|nr:hypothetical protein [Flaviaesturariibacter sp.]